MRSAECAVLGNFTDEVTLLGVAGQITLGILDLDLPCDIRDIIADVKNLAETDRVRWNLIGMLAFDLIGLIPVIGALKYSDETAESVASGEKMLKESQTVYESFADMMSPDDAAKYLDFLENGSKEGLTSAELADALLVSQKVGYEDVWDLRNAGDLLESGSGNKPYTNSRPSYGKNQVNEVWENAKDPITGKVYDPSGVEITWDKTKSRNGQWDMGHIPGEKYSEMHQLYMDDVISKDEFLEWYRNPKNYRPELPSTNRSHKYE